jgi:mannan endo-1,4-beta-mannosidase
MDLPATTTASLAPTWPSDRTAFVSTTGHASKDPSAPEASAEARRPYQARLALVVAVAIAAASIAFAASRLAPSTSGRAVAGTSLPARSASYLGVYAPGSPRAYWPVTDFAKAAGRRPNIVGYFSGWTQPFEESFAKRARSHGAVTIVQIDPTYALIQGIAAGAYDSYLRSYAGSVRDFGHPVIIGFGHEMNAPWYSWGYGHVPASTFVAAWRHIVTLFRRQNAHNVTWLWTIQADISSTGPVRSWWPGARYVTWVGIDGYYYRRSDTFARVFGPTIAQVRAFTKKPVLLSETAVGPKAGQVAKINDLFTGMRQYQTLGLVWFDMTQHQGIYHQDWRLEDNPRAEAAFRQSVRHKLTLAQPP